MTMKNLAFTLVLLGCIAIVVSCSYNTKDLPEPISENPSNPSAPADTTTNPTPTTNITYTSHIKTIIDNNCVGCHGSSGGVTLQTYTQVQTQANAGRILARAINGSGNGPMPPSGLMTQTTLDTLQMWLDQGALQ